ncbi:MULTISPECIES: VOC family protein [Rhizobium]|uniref:Glyoxalase/bleomycin resistance/extradiol dioxygenase family protein n=1 Tax=Rhizobium tropici TaxID=398 RepID=A0A6P1BYX4_RHITR|nr:MULTISPECIES: VOC family protein [Rhizobium]AGB71961.1 glyoxalase/bleomycin resistance protein/dioxygenase [Rhizobium tropici CIAT 899]MBB4243512.1 lactoylglutathione lyase [Rhizobium tropici]MBB5593168.1 lactoylglutathione lyase [Rhizobium tropici]MBB6493645.1 lactoylglutathione lyase [Rhizobium tropici]NEV09890.1 glyoxalase/bleomycin resistance/extradiol dioxygenase family protein [Rhizobium tropici]
MRIAHTALWTHDLDAAANFWEIYFGATVGEPYQSRRRPGFVSRFVSLPGSDDQIELMTGSWLPRDSQSERVGWDHIAISLGSKAAVDALAERCKAGDCLKSAPRTTGDGFYEAVITMPEGTPVEITI